MGESEKGSGAASPAAACAWCGTSLRTFQGKAEEHDGKWYHPDCWRYGVNFRRALVGWETEADRGRRPQQASLQTRIRPTESTATS